MITIGFTAARHLSPAGQDIITGDLTGLIPPAGPANAVPGVHRYVTGGCTGGDAFLGWNLYLLYPAALHWVILPANHSRIHRWWLHVNGPPVTVIQMPPGSTYADRNAAIVAASTHLYGYPAYPEHDHRSARSGTWQTLRMARKAGIMRQWHCVQPAYESGKT